MGRDPVGQTLPPTENKKAPTLLASPVHPPPQLCGTSRCGGELLAALSPGATVALLVPGGQGLRSLLPTHASAPGSCGTSFHRAEQGETEGVAPHPAPAPLRVCTPTLTLLRFQELGSCFISAWRYPRNFRKYIGSCASTDLILICELGFFFLLKLFGGATMPKLG